MATSDPDTTDANSFTRETCYVKGRMLFLLGLYLVIWSLLDGAGPQAIRAEPLSDIEGSAESLPWHIQADEITYNWHRKEFQARGNAVVTHAEKTIKAAQIVVNTTEMTARARGGVFMEMGADTLQATAVDIDLAEEKGVFTDSSLFFSETRFFVKGKRVEKTGTFSYTVKDALVTACDGERPDWRITGKQVDVTLNEYGFIRHGKLWVKSLPVFYTPFFIIPVKLDRQSGLLMPEFGISRKKGFELEQPLFWAINDWSDATFYDHFMADRGNKVGGEVRYILDDRSKGMFKVDYLQDRQVDDGSLGASDEWGYDHDAYLRPNAHRYWIRGKFDQALFRDFQASLDVDVVSDQDYLIEFKDGYTGYNAALSDFRNEFSRILDAYEDPVRLNQLNIHKSGRLYAVNASLKWYDNIIARKYLAADTTLQKLPQIRVGMLKQQIGELPFYFALDTDYTYFFSQDGTNGHRFDIHPTVFFPKLATPYFTLAPYVGFRETMWRILSYESSAGEDGKGDQHFRHVPDFHLDFNSELNRVYRFEKETLKALKHTIYPEIRYTYIPNRTQDEYPSFGNLQDGINRVDEQNQISLVITQFLTSKRLDPASGHDIDPAMPVYRRFLRFTLTQAYDIREALSDAPDEYRNGLDRRPFLPLDADFELIPFSFFSISANTQWSYYDHAFVEKNVALNFKNQRDDQLGVAYRYTRSELETITLNSRLWVTRRLQVFSNYERNLLEKETTETGFGFLYARACWSLEAAFSDKQDDRRYQFVINLKGLGGIGSR